VTMAETVDLHPAKMDGNVVYVAPAPLSTEAGGVRIAVLVLAAIAVLALVVLALVVIDGAIVMA